MTFYDEWWFSYLNRVAEAELDGGDEIAGFEPENVKNAREDEVWRVAGSTMTLNGELPSPATMQAVVIRVSPGVSWDASDTATLSLSNTGVGNDDVAEWTIPLDADPFTGCVVYLNETEETAQYFTLTLPSKDIEHVHIGPLFLPMNYNKGPDIAPDFSGVVNRSLFTSQKSVQEGPQTDRFFGQFEAWTLDEYQAWRTFSRTVGMTGSFAFGISQTTQLSESYIAHLTSRIALSPMDSRWIGQIQLEALR